MSIQYTHSVSLFCKQEKKINFGKGKKAEIENSNLVVVKDEKEKVYLLHKMVNFNFKIRKKNFFFFTL